MAVTRSPIFRQPLCRNPVRSSSSATANISCGKSRCGETSTFSRVEEVCAAFPSAYTWLASRRFVH
eukprot:9511358-Ditylum_brightwellii.AAC.1